MRTADRSRPERTPTANLDARLREALEANGQRFTEQRAAVYRFLAATETHPAAEEVFTGVRAQVAGISLSTVYKTLEALVSCGLATRLAYSGRHARYDGRMDPHHHARCVHCGAVLDVPCSLDLATLERLRPVSGFEVTGYRLELVGYCACCTSNRKLSP